MFELQHIVMSELYMLIPTAGSRQNVLFVFQTSSLLWSFVSVDVSSSITRHSRDVKEDVWSNMSKEFPNHPDSPDMLIAKLNIHEVHTKYN
jgi:general stress protein 26